MTGEFMRMLGAAGVLFDLDIGSQIPKRYAMKSIDRIEVITSNGEVLSLECAEPVMVPVHSGNIKGFEKVLRLEVKL